MDTIATLIEEEMVGWDMVSNTNVCNANYTVRVYSCQHCQTKA